MSSKTCLVVGGRGYLGNEVMRYLRHAGWRVISTAHHTCEDGDIPYSLGEDFPPSALDGIDALVHCAYDFRPCSWEQIYEKNVRGTNRLLEQATRAGIRHIITISTISAFPGCRSLYGKAKLLIEEATLAAGGVVLRPGLIYGGSNRGMYGRLEAQVRRGRPIPLLAGSPCTQFLIHVDDLSRLIEAILSGAIPKPSSVWTTAHPAPWPLRKLLSIMAGQRKLLFIPIPWQFVWLALWSAEKVGIRLTFKSDSVLSIINQNPRPDLKPVSTCGIPLRHFEPAVVS